MKSSINLVFAAIIFIFAQGAFAHSSIPTPLIKQSSNACENVASKNTKLAGRGCCSRHRGVCGCSGGRAVCCDGSLSPSCGCNSDSIRELMNSSRTKT